MTVSNVVLQNYHRAFPALFRADMRLHVCIGKFHTGIRRDPHKVKCIRVFGHQICTKAFARRQAGSIAGLNRKQRCFVFFGKAVAPCSSHSMMEPVAAALSL